MHLFDVLPDAKLNNLDLTPPDNDVTKGIQNWRGMIGERWMYSEVEAQKRSDRAKGFCGAGIYQMVRTLSTSVAALAVGRPVFWVDRKLFKVTPDIAATFLLPFAGIALNVPSAKGNIVMILICGEVDGLFAAALTKAVPVINDQLILKHTGGIAEIDVLADATALTGATERLRFGGRVTEAVVAGALSRIIVSRANEIDFQNGVI